MLLRCAKHWLEFLSDEWASSQLWPFYSNFYILYVCTYCNINVFFLYFSGKSLFHIRHSTFKGTLSNTGFIKSRSAFLSRFLLTVSIKVRSSRADPVDVIPIRTDPAQRTSRGTCETSLETDATSAAFVEIAQTKWPLFTRNELIVYDRRYSGGPFVNHLSIPSLTWN
jgi:hypothetical protein